MRNCILYLIQLPPPVHGVTKMNTIVYNSEIVNRGIKKELININFSKDILELQTFRLKKIVIFLKLLICIFQTFVSKRIDYVYFTLVPTRKAFLRDCIIVAVIKLFKKQIIYHLHGKGIKEECKKKRLKLLYKWVFNNSTVIHVSQRWIREDIEMLECKRIKTYYVHNGIEEFNSNSIIIKDNNHSIVNILFLSNISEEKGIFFLLDAIILLNSTCKNIRVDIVGAFQTNTIEKKVFEIICNNNLISKVLFHGPKYDNDKYSFFEKADIFVHPTFNEAFGLVILEAMQFALPVIATNEGAIPEIIDNGVSGYIVEKNDVTMLAEKIKYLISNKEIREDMGKNGQETFKLKFTKKIFEKKLRTVYEELFEK